MEARITVLRIDLALEVHWQNWCEIIMVYSAFRNRGAVTDDSLALNELLEDPEVTPKANQKQPRRTSAGVFLKDELQRRSHDAGSDRYSPQLPPHFQMYDTQSPRLPPTPTKTASPKIPERLPSKSKNFFLRAIGKQGDKSPKLVRRATSTGSRNTLVRRRQLRSKKDVDSSSSSLRQPSSSNSFFSLMEEASAVTDAQTPVQSDNDENRPLSATPTIPRIIPVYVLGTQIVVTPESSSVNTDACATWVAIEINGVLQRADGSHNVSDYTTDSDFQVLGMFSLTFGLA